MSNTVKRMAIMAVAVLVVGCAASNPLRSSDAIALASATTPETTAGLSQFNYPVTVRVAKYQDARRNAPSRKIGDVKANVMGINGPDLVVEDDVANMATAALKNRFGAAGFQVIETGSAQFEVSGAVKEFSLNILERDELAMVIETTLRDTKSGTVVWSGVVTEKTDRFAGVMGNSKKDVAKYLDTGLSTVSQKTADAITNSLKQVHPELFNQAVVNAKATPGVTVLAAPSATPVPASMSPGAAPMRQTAAVAASGYLAVTTVPSRVKVYIDDVYYGLSPIKLELDPGVHSVRFKADGFKAVAEKVSVRKGETTEMEMALEK